jgi:hypothetical protein
VALLATSALVIASAIGAASRSVAQDGSAAGTFKLAEAAQKESKKSATPRTVTPKTVAPRRTITSTPRVTPRSRTVTPKQLGTQKTITTKRVTPKVVTPKRTVTPKVVAPKTAAPKTVAPKTGSPTRLGLRAIGPTSTGKTLIRGRNYTVWRGTHRVRHDGRWATLAAISTLSVILFGGADYYPYGYISATGPYCEGVTEDGCILKWEEVPTLEGSSVLQCVAYCPWQ